jgi:Tfp pilus assembly protein PilO
MSIEKDQLIAVGIIALLFVAFSLAVWMPARKANADYRERIAAAEKALEPSLSDPEVLAKLDRQVQTLRVAVSSQTRTVPRQPMTASILRDLTESVRHQGIEQQELQTLETKHYRDFSAIPSRLEFVAGFDQTARVIEAIESLPRLVRFDRLEIQAQRTELTSPRLEASLELATFFRRDDGGGQTR